MRTTRLRQRLIPALLVKDMSETLAFYRKLGFELTGFHPVQERSTWAEVDRDGVVLQFHTELPSGTPPVPVCGETFYFYPADVGTLADELRGRVSFSVGSRLTLSP